MIRHFILAVLLTCYAAAQSPSNDNIIVVGNEAQPVQFTHKQNIQAAITKAAQRGGFVIIPPDWPLIETYTNPNNVVILDFRGGTLDIRPALTVNGAPAGGGGGTGCVVNPADAGCAIAGNPSIDLFVPSVGAGTGWLIQLLANGFNVKVPVNVIGSTAGVYSIGCGPDPGVGSGIALSGPSSCSPYTIYFPSSSASGFWRGSNTANKLTMTFQNQIDAANDIFGVLPLTNGGCGNSTATGCLVNLLPPFVRNGDHCCFWNGSAWVSLAGNSSAAGTVAFLTQNSGGSWSWTVSPLGTPVGGSGLNTRITKKIYKGAGTGPEAPSAIDDDATNITFSEPIKLGGSQPQASVQGGGTDTKLLAASTVAAGAGNPFCTDAAGGATTTACPVTPPSFNAPQKVTSGADSTMTTSGTVYTLLTESVTMPAAAGTYRVIVSYSHWFVTGANVCSAEVVDTTNNFGWAPSQHNDNGLGWSALVGSEVSTQTYAASATATFTLKAVCDGNGVTAKKNSAQAGTLSPNLPSYLSVTPVLTN